MIKLSDRLQKIADFIEPGESVADVGTDHGFLPIALWEQGKSPHVILSDINAGPLEKALNVKGELKTVGDSNKIIRTVGLCSGSGGDTMRAAIKNGCDLLITGDVRHHEAQIAIEKGICVIDAGHYGTEQIFAENFADKLRKNVGSTIQIIESEINTNPFKNVI